MNYFAKQDINYGKYLLIALGLFMIIVCSFLIVAAIRKDKMIHKHTVDEEPKV